MYSPEEVRRDPGQRSMSTRVGINGFGRMGRLALRAAWGWPELAFTHVNELHGDAGTAAHLLTFDSIHGRWSEDVHGDGDVLTVNGTALGYSSAAEPGDVPWGELGVEIVLECSGRFRTRGAPRRLFPPGRAQGDRRGAGQGASALNVVVGVNDHLYEPQRHHLLTAASCTTNCLAPVVKVIHEGIGIRHGLITTLHDMTNTQTLVDAPHKDLRRARAASVSLIPTTTGSATAIGLIFPELEGKLNGLAVRVPLLNASLTDCVFEVARPTTVEEVNGLLEAAADGPLAGILGYERRPLVSVDFKDDPRSGIVDAPSTMVTDETQVKILAWYDNEWGYANRLVELARTVAESLPARERHRRLASGGRWLAARQRPPQAPHQAPRRPAQLRPGDRGVLDGHARRRGDADARAVLLRPARLHAAAGRLAVRPLRDRGHRHEPRRGLARCPPGPEDHALHGPRRPGPGAPDAGLRAGRRCWSCRTSWPPRHSRASPRI